MTPRFVRLLARGVVAALVAALAVAIAGLPANAAAPANPVLTATPGNAQVVLNWTPGSGGGAATIWAVYRITVTNGVDGAATLVKTNIPAATRTYTDTGRTNGTAYRYAVWAGNADGAKQSNIVTVTPTAGGSTPTPTPTPTTPTPTPTTPAPIPGPNAATLTATANGTAVNLAWMPAATGGAVATWDLYRSTTSPLNTATATKIGNNLAASTVAATDSGLAAGTYYYVVVAKNATSTAASAQKSATIVPSTDKPKLVISNPDAVPGSDRYVMSRMEYFATPTSMLRILDPDNGDYGTPTWYGVHDVATVHVDNTGTAAATITGLTTSNAQVFTTSTPLPLTVPAGGSVDLPVRFVYLGTGTACTGSAAVYGPMVCRGTLTIQSTGLANIVAPLSGQWSPGASREAGLTGTAYCYRGPVDQPCKRPLFEPWLTQVVNGTFGFGTSVGATTFLNSGAPSARFGDEVTSKFWKAADPNADVTVTRLSAASGAGLGAVRWYPSTEAAGCSTSTAGGCQSIMSSWYPAGRLAEVADPNALAISQGVLPVQPGQARTKTFAPGAASFGLKMNSEFSDYTRNDTTTDVEYGHCSTATNCGQHMRWFPVKNASGQLVPNTYFVANDLGGLNLDYNDNVLLLTNVKPG